MKNPSFKFPFVFFILHISLFLFHSSTIHAQYVRIRADSGAKISTNDINLRAQKLTRQCQNLHIAAAGCEAIGIGLIALSLTTRNAGGLYGRGRGGRFAVNSGLAVAGVAVLLGGPVLGILEWFKVSEAHTILSLGNPKFGFYSGSNGIGLAFNF